MSNQSAAEIEQIESNVNKRTMGIATMVLIVFIIISIIILLAWKTIATNNSGEVDYSYSDASTTIDQAITQTEKSLDSTVDSSNFQEPDYNSDFQAE